MQLTIEKLGHHGDGIAQGIFAPQTLPNEVVTGDLQGDRLTNIRILTPSPNRVKPPCAHARACGGCLMQHATDDLVARWKSGIVAGALAGQGLQAEIRPILTSVPRSRRRATLTGKRTKTGALIGFHQRGSENVIPVPDCQLLHPDLMTAFPALEALVITGGSRSSELALTITRAIGGIDVDVTGGKPLDSALQLGLARLVETHALSRLTWNGETVAIRAMPLQIFGSARVACPPGAFLQATEHGEAALLAAVRAAVVPAKRLADLFAGCGTFSLPLAQHAEVLAVEGEVSMTAALEKGWRQAEGLKRVTVETRDLFRRPLEPSDLRPFDAVVLDPPRAGAEAQSHCLAKSSVAVIAYVSCNPASFARDARILTDAGYRLDWVQPVDQFRWSDHTELVARFCR